MKILISVFVPAIGETYDVLIPDFLSVQEVIPLLVNDIEFLSNNRYISTGQELLCQRETNTVFSASENLGVYHLKNGEQLVLI